MNFNTCIQHKAVFILLLLTPCLYGQNAQEASVVLNTSAEAICTANPFLSFMPQFTDDGTFGSDRKYIYEHSGDSISWTVIAISSLAYTQRPANLQEGWYRVSVSHSDETDLIDRHITSEPVYLQKTDGGCTPFAKPWKDEISKDVCEHGILLFREDFGGNNPQDPVTGMERLTTMSTRYMQAFNIISSPHSGWYIVAKHGWQNGLNTSTSENLYSQWFVQDDHTYPNDYTRGYMLEVDGVGGNDAFYTTIFPVCGGLDMSFSAYVANILEPGHNFARPKVRFVIQDAKTGQQILEQSSGAIAPAPDDYLIYGFPTVQSAPWHLVGASFTVPDSVNELRLSIYNDEISSMGNDFAMDDIEIRLCNIAVIVDSEPETCKDSSYIFTADISSGGGFKEPYSCLWQYAKDSLPHDSDGWTDIHLGQNLIYEKISIADSGWYRLCVASEGIDVETEISCRAVSKPFHLTVNDCTPPCPELATVYDDALVCDTLMPYQWKDTLFNSPSTIQIMYRNRYGCDSLLYVYTLDTVHCENTDTIHHEQPDTIHREEPDTVKDEKLWHIIVNKYNRQLLCDNVALRSFFPDKHAQSFQWYKDGLPVAGATEDDYAEQDELHGSFQLRVILNDGQTVWSNIIELTDTPDGQYITKRIYDSRGRQVSEEQAGNGIHLYIYERSGKVWSEKKLIR